MPTIWIIGDSTVADGAPPFRGWGLAFPALAAEGVRVINRARGGRSARSYWEEGLFADVQAALQPGDLLLMQFGHNDEMELPARHTDPQSTFPAYLARYCDAAAACGALPVLITPVSRSYFYAGGTELLYTHGEYAPAVRKLAQERHLPLIDLKKISRSLFLSLGEEKTMELFVCYAPGEHPDFPEGRDDKTHLNETGARRIALLVAEAMQNDERLRPYVKPIA